MMVVAKSTFYALYILVLAYLVFIGGDMAIRRLDLFSFHNPISYLPFKNKFMFFLSGGAWHHSALIYFFEEMLGNLVLFIPFSLILMLGEGVSNTKKIILAAFCTSLFIETTQYATNLGHADIDDLILNTAGGFLGIKLAQWVKKQHFWPSVEMSLQAAG